MSDGGGTPPGDHTTTSNARHDPSSDGRPDIQSEHEARPQGPAETKAHCQNEKHKMGGRNLVVCIDGTAQKLGKKSTNVIELFKLLMKEGDSNQLCWYASGVGTYARPRWKSPKHYLSVVYHKIDSVIAWDIERIVQEAYQWIAENYQDGDRIFLFGFSRGAFQVRALSAMISKVGLIHKGNVSQIPFAYEHYARAEISEKHKLTAEQFKKSFSRDVQVHFVGAWDTVSSVGTGRGHEALPGTINGMDHVCFFRHALALDERRVMFQPEFAHGGTTLPVDVPPPRFEDPVDTHPRVLEVWFPGTHSDIGRGPPITDDPKQSARDATRGRPALRWMASHAAELGLRIDKLTLSDVNGRDDPEDKTQYRDSLSGFWYLFEIFPFQRLTFARKWSSDRGKGTTRIPHLGTGRKIHDGQKFHYSVVSSIGESYIPKARPKKREGRRFWDILCSPNHPYVSRLIERDLFYRASDAVKDLLAGSTPSDLAEIVADNTGFQWFYDEIVDALRMREQRLEPKQLNSLLRTTVDLSVSSERLKLEDWREIHGKLAELLGSNVDDYKRTALDFERRFLKDPNFFIGLHGHENWVNAVAISEDGQRVTSGSSDGTIRVWEHGITEEELCLIPSTTTGNRQAVYSIALFPDGKGVVFGSLDSKIRTWDGKTGSLVSELEGHTKSVKSLAISADGKRIISGSADGTIRIWEGEPWRDVRTFAGNKGPVKSVAISRDGKCIVSSHQDGTILLWDSLSEESPAIVVEGGLIPRAQEGQNVPDTRANCLTIDPDGTRIVSGHNDGTISVWDAKTGTQIGEQLRGHTGTIQTIGVSAHDPNYIISGSNDGTVNIWNLERGKQVWAPLRGHTGSVNAVASSADGRRIVSGSDDKTVRVWDVEDVFKGLAQELI